VSNELTKAWRYRDLAAECVRLADIAVDPPMREGFRSLARSYLELAQAELLSAEKAVNGAGYSDS
jgi:hypothetical protein